MSMQPYTDEELNYFKFASIVLKEFPDALRSIFKDMWNTRIAPRSTTWDDSPFVRNILHNNEAPNTKIPTSNSFKEWDCTALFQATLYAKTFALPDGTGKKKTLGEMYLKGRKPVPGPFHSAVRSSSGDANETIALAIDQLRLLRNSLCHTSNPKVNKITFDDHVSYAKDAFTALNVSTTSLDRIGNMKESDFPTEEVEKLSEKINLLKSNFCSFLESEVKDEITDVKHEVSEVKQKLNSIEDVLIQTKATTDACTATSSSSELKYFNDVLLLTMDDTEFNEAQKILNNVEIPSKKGETDKNCCFGEIGGNKVTLLKVPCIAGKTDTSSVNDVLVYETIHELKPKAIVSLGVCDGVKKEAHFLGDVLVSSQVYFPEQEVVGLSSFDRTRYDCDLGLVQLFDRGKFAWTGPCENVLVPKIRVGQFSTTLQNGDDRKQQLNKGGTIGIDTASRSVYATCQNSGIPWLSCKSIAKWENEECQNSSWCQFGAAVSASFVQHVLKRFYISDDIQIFDKSVPKPYLPSIVPHFIGRHQKVDDILQMLASTSTQLVSLSGPPGFGKTSLAIAVGHRLTQLGLPVYFFSLRNVKTAEELILDLLNAFEHTSSDITGRGRSKLCGVLRSIPSNIFIVLDNADDLFESSRETSQDILELLEKIFSYCKNVSILLTTRMSLQLVLGRKFGDHMSVSVASLDRKSAQMLVQELVSYANENECYRVAEICGDVPLVIKLLCGQIADERKSVSQFLDNFSRSSKKLTALLDDPDAPNDQRFNVLFESYFKRLSREEQEAFVCLSVFVSETFDEQAAVNVIGGDEDNARKTLLRLKRKYLVEENSSEAMVFSFHPLVKSFASEKAADMKEICCEAQDRFLSYYVKLFEDLNDKFLSGSSLHAFHDFELNKENIVHCLSEGVRNETVCGAIFDVLSDGDLFLDTVFFYEKTWIFDKIYDLAIARAKERQKFNAIYQLLIARAFFEIQWDAAGATLPLLREAEEMEKQNLFLNLELSKGKRMCYHGIYLLLCKATSKASEIIEAGISLLNSENTVLKLFCSQVLALITPDAEKTWYYQNIVLTESANRPSLCALFKAIQNGDCACEEQKPKALDQPLIFGLVLFFNAITNNADVEQVGKLGLLVSKLRKEVEVEAQKDCIYRPILLLARNTLAEVEIEKQETLAELQLDLENCIKENGRLNAVTAERYHNIGEFLYIQKNYDGALSFFGEGLDIRLKLFGTNHEETAKSYNKIGSTRFHKGDYELALQSLEKALEIRKTLHGKIHQAISVISFWIGMAKRCLKEYELAIYWYQQALDISVAVYGKEHTLSAESYYYIAECHCEMENYDFALESCQQAFDIRLKLFGQESEDTKSSCDQMEFIRTLKKVCKLSGDQRRKNLL